MIYKKKIVFTDTSEGRLSVKLETYNEAGHCSWHDFSIYDVPPDNSKILIFNDLLGIYEYYTNIEEARARYLEHHNRLQVPSIVVDNEDEIPGVLNKYSILFNKIGVTIACPNQTQQSPSFLTFLPN